MTLYNASICEANLWRCSRLALQVDEMSRSACCFFNDAPSSGKWATTAPQNLDDMKPLSSSSSSYIVVLYPVLWQSNLEHEAVPHHPVNRHRHNIPLCLYNSISQTRRSPHSSSPVWLPQLPPFTARQRPLRVGKSIFSSLGST
jgi:hypothetical protein